jgi:hypothetical protein
LSSKKYGGNCALHARDLNLHGAANRTEWQHNSIGLYFPADTPSLWSYCNSQELKCQVVFGYVIINPDLCSDRPFFCFSVIIDEIDRDTFFSLLHAEIRKHIPNGKSFPLTTECIYRSKITTFKETRRMIDYFIYYYNHQRIQLKTKLTPLELRSQFVA